MVNAPRKFLRRSEAMSRAGKHSISIGELLCYNRHYPLAEFGLHLAGFENNAQVSTGFHYQVGSIVDPTISDGIEV